MDALPPRLDVEAFADRSRALDLAGLDWDEVARRPLSADAVRALDYMQDVESHTIVYQRELAATRALDEPRIATFLACWVFEEVHHGRALRRFLAAAGHPVGERGRWRRPRAEVLKDTLVALVARAWPDFLAVHMTWGALNELSALMGYRRLAELEGHPVLDDLLHRIMRDESRHFGFYFGEASQRLARPRTARLTRALVDHFWSPVGSDVRSRADTEFLARALFGGRDGRDAARRIDATIQKLPGFDDARPLERWLDAHGVTAAQEAGRRERDAFGRPRAATPAGAAARSSRSATSRASQTRNRR